MCRLCVFPAHAILKNRRQPINLSQLSLEWKNVFFFSFVFSSTISKWSLLYRVDHQYRSDDDDRSYVENDRDVYSLFPSLHSYTQPLEHTEQHLILTFFTNRMCVAISIFHPFGFFSISSWTHITIVIHHVQFLCVCKSAVNFSINLNGFFHAFNGYIVSSILVCFFRLCFGHETFLRCRGVVPTSFVPLLTSRTFPFNWMT